MAFDHLQYMSGFGNEFQSEDPRCPGSLPVGQNQPQQCPYGLYMEMLTGSAFTAPRDHNRRSFLYRIRPSLNHSSSWTKLNQGNLTNNFDEFDIEPTMLQWQPFPFPSPETKVDFIQGFNTLCGAGDTKSRHGAAIHIYCCNASMGNKAFFNTDGDLLIVPQKGTLRITTEFGKMAVEPEEICILQQGMRFNVEVDEESRGYILEVYDAHFRLPELGPIGSHCLANSRDFKTPTAWYEDKDLPGYQIVNKFAGKLFFTEQDHSPFDVVAWHGNYAPYKYNLQHFVSVNTARFDHPDPSISTVLTCQSTKPGVGIVDLAAFPPVWNATEHTFRPPQYHRNCAIEFTGIIGQQDTPLPGLHPGGASFVGMMLPHGVSSQIFEYCIKEKLEPKKILEGNIVIMFESSLNMVVTPWGSKHCCCINENFPTIREGFKKHFNQQYRPATFE